MTDLQFGDTVRHRDRPEWGIGTVVQTEGASCEGRPCQRVRVRFSGAGLKVLITAVAPLERVADEPVADAPEEVADFEAIERMSESDWLAPMAGRKLEALMMAIPEACRDPFRSLEERLAASLALYRFTESGASLVEWAVAQTALEDPLSRFSRHELEEHFRRWARERHGHLKRLLAEARGRQGLLEPLLEAAPPGAREAVGRL